MQPIWRGVATDQQAATLVGEEITHRRVYRGVLYRQRLDRWQLLASYTWSEAEGNLFRDDGLDDLGSFARVIDSHGDKAQALLEDFEQADKQPTIAISVDMLDTGIDVPEILKRTSERRESGTRPATSRTLIGR